MSQAQHDFFIEQTISTTDFADGLVSWDFVAQGILFLNLGTTILQYSFDGVIVHGDLDPSNASKGISFDARPRSQVWFRLKSTGAASNVRVECWQGT